MNKLSIIIFAILFAANLNMVLGQSKAHDKSVRDITAALNSTADGWNAGDLAKYLAVYVPGATEMTGEGPKGGVEHIEQTMKGGFWKTGRPLQVLRYENVAVRMLGKKDALVTGQYILSGGGRPDRKGWFTTVWTKTKDGWRMIHDHSYSMLDFRFWILDFEFEAETRTEVSVFSRPDCHRRCLKDR